MRSAERTEQDYSCPKCRNRHCATRELMLPHSSRRGLFNKHNERFLVVSCTLCGYTEFYSLRSAVKEKARDSSPVAEEST